MSETQPSGGGGPGGGGKGWFSKGKTFGETRVGGTFKRLGRGMGISRGGGQGDGESSAADSADRRKRLRSSPRLRLDKQRCVLAHAHLFIPTEYREPT